MMAAPPQAPDALRVRGDAAVPRAEGREAVPEPPPPVPQGAPSVSGFKANRRTSYNNMYHVVWYQASF